MGAMTKQQARLIYWTPAQLAIARDKYPEAGSFRAEDPGPGAYGSNLSDDELAVMMRIGWKRVAAFTAAVEAAAGPEVG